MGQPTCLLYGTPAHPSLALLHQALQARAGFRVVFLAQERYPRDVGLYLPAGEGAEPPLLLLPDQEPIACQDLVSVCLDGFYIAQEGLKEFTPEDVTYLQTESWAALIALFHRLSQHCLVANHITQRDLISSRLSELGLLSRCGLPVPRATVTSDPEAFRRFYDELGGKVLARPVAGMDPAMREVVAEELETADKLLFSPVHFEEVPEGPVCRLVVVGEQVRTVPEEASPPDAFREAVLEVCRRLRRCHLAEALVRESPRGWLATGFRTFISAETLPAVLEPVVELLSG